MKIIYEDENVLAYDKAAGVNVDSVPLRVHRLDKDTSGVFLVAKNEKALQFLQKQFRERLVEKKYIALVTGNLKNTEGIIETLLGRSPKDKRKQKVYLPHDPKAGSKREAITAYRVIGRFKIKDYKPLAALAVADARRRKFKNWVRFTLLEVEPKTGRKHQIRAHMAYLGHPIAGDKLYGFKGQAVPEGLKRQFLHAKALKIQLPDGKIKEFVSPLPNDLEMVLSQLHHET